MTHHLQTIRRASAWGLWGAVGMVILTAAFFLSPWHFTTTPHTTRWALIAGAVLAVLSVSMVLLNVRRTIPQLRQNEDLEEKLSGYAAHIKSLFLTMLAVVVLICIFALMSSHSVLLMLAMVCTLVLIMNYPGIYRIKVDLGLTDEQMHTLFGDRYPLEQPPANDDTEPTPRP